MAEEPEVVTTLPHSSFGDPDCGGCLNGVLRGDQADIVCNKCDFVVRTVARAELRQTLTEWNSRSTFRAPYARTAER
jgi:hypothetical protein